MTFDPERHHRRSIRLRSYDYARAGAYFVTVCTRERACLFGDVIDNAMVLNEVGRVVAEEWMRTPRMRVGVEIDQWVVMPNHLHGIVVIEPDGAQHLGDRQVAPTHRPVEPPDAVRARHLGDRQVAPTIVNPRGPRPRSLGAIVAGFKSATTKRINILRDAPGVPVWQRNYYEHIIRSDDELHRIRQYIADNPRCWTIDAENPDRAIESAETEMRPWEA